MRTLKNSLYVVLSAWGICTTSLATAQNYKFTDLGTLGGTYSNAAAINEAGQVVGSANLPGVTSSHATLWNKNSAIDLDSSASNLSGASAINDAGQVVGFSGGQAAIWTGNTVSKLGTLGGSRSYATGINNAGVVVGQSQMPGDISQHAVVWANNKATDLGTMGGGSSFANGINDSGQIAGWSITASGAAHAVLWTNNIGVDLGSIQGTHSYGTAVNNNGWVVGEDGLQAALWHGGIEVLLTTKDRSEGLALSLNNKNQIVGLARTADVGWYAALWVDGSETDLNNFLSPMDIQAGWHLHSANGINDNGSIVGSAYNIKTGESHAYLLEISPVPEPKSYAQLLAGLAVAYVFVRRRSAHN